MRLPAATLILLPAIGPLHGPLPSPGEMAAGGGLFSTLLNAAGRLHSSLVQPIAFAPGADAVPPFLQLFLAGLLHGGFAGMLWGNGFSGALPSFPGVLGLLLQFIILYAVLAWLGRRLIGRMVPAGGSLYTRFLHPGVREAAPILSGRQPGARAGHALALKSGDYRAFEELLHCMQAAWCAHDLSALRSMTTDTMAKAYAAQAEAQQAQGLHDQVAGLELKRSEVLDAWSDGKNEVATLRLKYTMLDVTLDQWGQTVAGSAIDPVDVIEHWTFNRTPPGRWRVSSIEKSS